MGIYLIQLGLNQISDGETLIFVTFHEALNHFNIIEFVIHVDSVLQIHVCQFTSGFHLVGLNKEIKSESIINSAE